jgi:hypothetical protein
MSSSIVSRVAVFAVVVLFLVVNGCVTPSVRPGHVALEQKGRITLASEAEQEVVFETPYNQAPEIQLKDDSLNEVKVVECSPGRFRVRNNSYEVQQISWTATGERVAPAK